MKTTKWLARLLISLVIVLAPPNTGIAGETVRSATFDEVWTTINEDYFDPEFGGVDWVAVGERYRGVAIAAETDSIFYVRLNEMLFELGVSHAGVIPLDHPEWIGAPSVFSDGGIGAEARIVEGEIVITTIRQESAAGRAGLRPGFVIREVNGKTLATIEAEALTPPRPPLDDRLLVTQKLLDQLYGRVGTPVTIVAVDGKGRTREATLVREARPGRTLFMEGIPAAYLDFESRWIERNIGYIRFNAFHPDLLDQILDAIDRMHQSVGMIIDLRGNVGGVFAVRREIARRFVLKRSLFWQYRRRDVVDPVFLSPTNPSYTGAVAILTDCMSASSSEEFAGAMQAIGRAIVVGERTPGNVLVASIEELPGGGTLVYPSAQTRMPDGTVLEGRGVFPNVDTRLTISSLLGGRDAQLDAAVEEIRIMTSK